MLTQLQARGLTRFRDMVHGVRSFNKMNHKLLRNSEKHFLRKKCCLWIFPHLKRWKINTH